MFKICTIFEDWLIEDGSYPELHTGQKINLTLSLEVGNNHFKVVKAKKNYFKKIKYSEYSFCGKIISDDSCISIGNINKIVTRFNTGSSKNITKKGDLVEGVGNLNVDLIDLENEYEAIIEKINKVYIPEKFISRSEKGRSYPCSLIPKYYSRVNVKQVDIMPNNFHKPFRPLNDEACFYLLDLNIVDDFTVGGLV